MGFASPYSSTSTLELQRTNKSRNAVEAETSSDLDSRTDELYIFYSKSSHDLNYQRFVVSTSLFFRWLCCCCDLKFDPLRQIADEIALRELSQCVVKVFPTSSNSTATANNKKCSAWVSIESDLVGYEAATFVRRVGNQKPLFMMMEISLFLLASSISLTLTTDACLQRFIKTFFKCNKTAIHEAANWDPSELFSSDNKHTRGLMFKSLEPRLEERALII